MPSTRLVEGKYRQVITKNSTKTTSSYYSSAVQVYYALLLG